VNSWRRTGCPRFARSPAGRAFSNSTRWLPIAPQCAHLRSALQPHQPRPCFPP